MSDMPTREEWEAGIADFRRIQSDLNTLVKLWCKPALDDSVPIPVSADQAVLMISLGVHYLGTNAPDRLRPEMRPLADAFKTVFSG